MQAEIIEIQELNNQAVSFYTIKFDGKTQSEFAYFYEKLSKEPKNLDELNLLFAQIAEISKRGAKPYYFNRPEKNAHALPNKSKSTTISTSDYGIRLYCVLVNFKNVFLLNGDRKKTLKATDPKSNVSKYFRQANSLYDELIKDKGLGLITWKENKGLIFENDYRISIQG